MKLRIFLLIGLAITAASCGSKKVVTTTQRTKKVVVKDNPIPLNKTELPVLTPEKRTAKTTINNTQDYVNKFAPIAIREMHKYKIPASITLAQGILESGSGRSPLAIRSNNHFGIKCHKGWKGKSVTHDDDEIAECFRKYKYPETSYEDHSQFLTSRKRYAGLFRLKTTDYKNWAYGLKKAGYATDRKYPVKLISLIRKYNLHQYDYVTPKQLELGAYGKVPTETRSESKAQKNYHTVVKGDTLYSIARKYNTSVASIKKANGLRSNTISIGQQLKVN